MNQVQTETARPIMHKIFAIGIASFSCFAITFAFASAATAQDPKFHIYLCFDQSNMQGSAKIEKQEKASSDRFLLLQSTDNWTGS